MKEKYRKRAVLLGGACVYALLYALGSQIDARGSVDGAEALYRFAAALPVSCGLLYVLLDKVISRSELSGQTDAGRGALRFSAAAFVWLAACYGAMFLIHYPGSFMYDTQRQVFQIARGEYEMFHPLLHTLLIRACLACYDLFDSFEKCAALYSAVQVMLFSACFSQVCASLRRMYGSRAACVSLAFFGLYPSHWAFASNCTKDGLFSAFFALFLTLCFEEVLHGGLTKPRRALWLAAGTLSCLLRNNMIYAFAVWTVFLIVQGRRYFRAAVCAVLAIALCTGVNSGLQKMTDAADGSRIEMLSVPIQQLSRARLYAPECFSQEEKQLMDEVFVDALYGTSKPLYMHYEPTLADPVKNYLSETVVMDRFPALADMWMRVGAKCPGVYLDAFLNLALPSLYPYSAYRVAQPYIETGLQPGVVTAPFGQPPMSQPSRFRGIRDWLYTHVFSTGADSVPVVRYLFNTGFIFWLLLLMVIYELYTANWTRFALLMLPVLLWGTYLLGPVMQGRYLYPFICVLPLFVLRRR